MQYIFLGVYFAVTNLTSFVLMGLDKKRAIEHKWRIAENKLFLSALIGGSVGAVAGMHFFHHKTRHWYFAVGMPAILILHIVIILLCCFVF